MKTVLLFLSALLLLACAGKPPEPIKQYPMRGVVTQLDPQNQVATIKHEDIPGFMHAMTMEYGLRDKNDTGIPRDGQAVDCLSRRQAAPIEDDLPCPARRIGDGVGHQC